MAKKFHVLDFMTAKRLGVVRHKPGSHGNEWIFTRPSTAHQLDVVRKAAIKTVPAVTWDTYVGVDSDAIVVEEGPPVRVHWIGEMKLPDKNPERVARLLNPFG